MVCRIILADVIALKGAEPATGFEELAIITTKNTQKKKKNRQPPGKAKTFKMISPF